MFLWSSGTTKAARECQLQFKSDSQKGMEGNCGFEGCEKKKRWAKEGAEHESSAWQQTCFKYFKADLDYSLICNPAKANVTDLQYIFNCNVYGDCV